MRADADAIDDPEGAALLRWFADGAMTLLGYHVERPTGQPTEALGLFRLPGEPTDEGGASARCAGWKPFRAARRQGGPPLDRPPPGAARPRRRSDPRERQGRPGSASMPACGPARR
jgi:hypothetical protein